VLADRAGIDQDNVGFLDVICQREACLHKVRTDQGGIELVHLTPVGLEAHFHCVHPNLNTGAPTSRFAFAKRWGQPSLFVAFLVFAINSNESFLFLAGHFLDSSFTSQSVLVVAILFRIDQFDRQLSFQIFGAVASIVQSQAIFYVIAVSGVVRAISALNDINPVLAFARNGL